jgi:glycerol-3-phosphate dehydrogenase
VLFAIPWYGRLLVGTTDEEAKLDDELYVEKEEVAYVLRQLNKYLARPVTPSQIVSGTAGLRPLVSSGKSADTKNLARDHEVEFDQASGLISIMGGKWTTHRAMAEDTLDATQKYLKEAGRKCSTLSHPLLGSAGYAPDLWRSLAARFTLTEKTARHLAQKYGMCAPEVMKLADADPDLARPLLEGFPALRAQVVFGAREELAVSIEDILARRVGLQLYGWRDAIRAAPAVAELLARELAWPESTRHLAITEYVAKIQGLIERAGI